MEGVGEGSGGCWWGCGVLNWCFCRRCLSLLRLVGMAGW